MSSNQQFARTVRIAIPLKEEAEGKANVPRIAKSRHLAGQTSWIVTQTSEAGSDRYQVLLHSLYDGVLITKSSGRIVDFNARAVSLLQYEQKELSNLNVMDIIVGANDKLLQAICKNIEGNRFTLIDAYCIRKDKSTFPAEIATNRLVLTQEGHLCFFLRDVTRRKKAEEELIHTVSKLKELDNAKSRLVSNVSHGLRTPLAIISSFVSLVHDGIAGAITDQQKECLATVLRNCDRLANLIDDVLDLGRIESGREEFKRRALNLPDLLRQCHHDFLPKFLLRRQQLNLEIPEGGVPDALGDSDKITQVMTSLLDNANKHTLEGCEITVRLAVEDGQAVVTVEDNGPGIAPEDQGRMFEAFTQIEKPDGTTTLSKGAGLGLTIGKHIIEAHDGGLKVESEVGTGTRFYFTLPLYDEQKGFQAFVNDRLRFMEAKNQKPTLVFLRCEGGATGYKSPEKDGHDKTWPSSTGEKNIFSKVEGRALSRPSDSGNQLGEKDIKPDGKSILQQLQAALVAALGCADLHTFIITSQNGIMVLTDRTDLNKETMFNRLQAEINARVQDPKLSVSFAYLHPERTTSSQELLVQAKSILEPLPLMHGLEKIRRVLVIDDDPPVLKMMTDLIAQVDSKIDVKSTTSGYDACIHFGNWKPDLVILDLHLPDIDGKKVFQSMVKGDRERRMKFLAVSGYPEDIKEIMKLGCNDSLEKPFDFKKFVEKVRSLLALPGN